MCVRMTPEGKLQHRLILRARKLGVETIRLSFSRGVTSGWPDTLLLVHGGQPLLVEFKRPGKVPTELQAHRIALLRGWGYDVLATDSFDEACEALTRAMGSAALHGAGGKAPHKKPRRRPSAPSRRP